SLLVGVDARPVLSSGLVSLEAGRLHQPALNECLRSLDVDTAPDAAPFARRKANGIAEFVDALSNTINPPEAQCFVDSFRPGDARPARAYFVKADQQRFSHGMILCQACAESSR